MNGTSTAANERARGFRGINFPLLALSGGFIVAFCLFALIDYGSLTRIVDAAFAWSLRIFGFYWQLLMLAYFVVGLVTAFLPGATAKLGGLDKPEFSTFKWASMYLCTLLASGGVFWAAGEPIAHFASPPPYFGDDAGSVEAAYAALAQTFLHWGFLPWALFGGLSAVMLMTYHYDKGLPLAPRVLLYPLFGRQAIEGPVGLLVDTCAVIALIAGLCAPIGLLSLQLGYGFEALLGIPDGFAVHASVIAVLFAIYTLSAVTGIDKGIQALSRANIILGALLLVFVIMAGPSLFILEGYFAGLARHFANFFQLALYREAAGIFEEPGWEGSWTLFFWAWNLGFAPLVAVFVARISRGRSFREIVVMTTIVAPFVTTFWFTILGGTGLALDLADPGAVTGPFEGGDLPAALFAITQALPFGLVITLLFLLLSTLFIVTTSDSTCYVVSVAVSSSDNPQTAVRVFLGAALAATALVLVYDGPGAIGNLQSLIVVTAVPISLVMLSPLWEGPRLVLALGRARKD